MSATETMAAVRGMSAAYRRLLRTGGGSTMGENTFTPPAKLTAEQKRVILMQADTGRPRKDIAAEFGLSEPSLSRLIKRLRKAAV